MENSMPILLVPGLVSSPRIFAPVIPALWRFGPVTVANHIRDDNMGAIARRILAEAPPRFALAGHSMGGYIAFEIMRQASERVAKLALINTQARPDTAEVSARRRGMMARATSGEYCAVLDELFEKHRGQGFAKEAARALVAWALGHGAKEVYASVSPDNAPSLAVVRSLGFKQVGTQDDEVDGLELVFAIERTSPIKTSR